MMREDTLYNVAARLGLEKIALTPTSARAAEAAIGLGLGAGAGAGATALFREPREPDTFRDSKGRFYSRPLRTSERKERTRALIGGGAVGGLSGAGLALAGSALRRKNMTAADAEAVSGLFQKYYGKLTTHRRRVKDSLNEMLETKKNLKPVEPNPGSGEVNARLALDSRIRDQQKQLTLADQLVSQSREGIFRLRDDLAKSRDARVFGGSLLGPKPRVVSAEEANRQRSAFGSGRVSGSVYEPSPDTLEGRVFSESGGIGPASIASEGGPIQSGPGAAYWRRVIANLGEFS